jgi:hypothetical protein
VINQINTTSWRRMEECKYSYTILDLGPTWRWVVSFKFWPLYPGTQWIGGWMGPRTGLDYVKWRTISFPCWESNPGRPGRSPSLYGFPTPICEDKTLRAIPFKKYSHNRDIFFFQRNCIASKTFRFKGPQLSWRHVFHRDGRSPSRRRKADI